MLMTHPILFKQKIAVVMKHFLRGSARLKRLATQLRSHWFSLLKFRSISIAETTGDTTVFLGNKYT